MHTESLPELHSSLVRWMQLYLATLLGETADDISVRDPIKTFDLDSIDAVTMAIELEDRFDMRLTPEYFLNGKLSITDVANAITDSTI